MNVEEFRDYCLSLKGTKYKMPWTEPEYSSLMVFEVVDKWYGFVDIDKFEFCDLKCDPERSIELQERYEGVKPGWHMNHKHWISVYFNKDVPDSLIKELVASAHDIVLKTLPRKVQNEIMSE
ncbi:MAG: MmcQ/YjbR family DNA-binding protein [Muribaculum sp.]|nr:MmcQ/YjbR family DNA-binding protein [Muribaculum sp.]